MRPQIFAGLVLIAGVAAALPFRRQPPPPHAPLPERTGVESSSTEPLPRDPRVLQVDPVAPPVPQAAPEPERTVDAPQLAGGYGEVAVPLAEPRAAVDSRLRSVTASPAGTPPRVLDEADAAARRGGTPSAVAAARSGVAVGSRDPASPRGAAPPESSAEATPRTEHEAPERPLEGRFRTGLPLAELTVEVLPSLDADMRGSSPMQTAAASPDALEGESEAGAEPEQAASEEEADLPAPRARHFIREPAAR